MWSYMSNGSFQGLHKKLIIDFILLTNYAYNFTRKQEKIKAGAVSKGCSLQLSTSLLLLAKVVFKVIKTKFRHYLEFTATYRSLNTRNML